MTSVGVRQLRQRASELLRRVEAGETIEVTDRGRPVAILAPLPEGEPLGRLRASGEVIPATADFGDLPEPMTVDAGADLPSAILARLRRDER
jgi:prevent-host-death family protein